MERRISAVVFVAAVMAGCTIQMVPGSGPNQVAQGDTTRVVVYDTVKVKGRPDTVTVVQRDTVRVKARDTITVVQHDTVRVKARDTVTVVRRDTVRVVVRDTVRVVQRDTVTRVVRDRRDPPPRDSVARRDSIVDYAPLGDRPDTTAGKGRGGEDRPAGVSQRRIAIPRGITGSRPVRDNPNEPRLRNVRQLTFGGENAEAYFSADGRRLIFQATWPGATSCDQMFTMRLDGTDVRQVSTGTGRTTCGYLFPGRDRVLYSSTHHTGEACPAPPDRSRGYVWPLYDYDIYAADADGANVQRILGGPSYDAEATMSPDGSKIVFTSDRGGDLDLWIMNADGSGLRQITHDFGYDGGAFFSPDGRQLVYRAYHPQSEAERADYRALLRDRLIRPTKLDIYVINVDGTGRRRVTNNGKANFAPFFHPSGQKIIFSSNMSDASGRHFDLYLINVDGSGVERVTHSPDFDGFPMFSPDGKMLVFGSNRGQGRQGETNVFLADWVEDIGDRRGNSDRNEDRGRSGENRGNDSDEDRGKKGRD